MPQKPGPIILFGSGETSASGRTIWAWLLRQLPHAARVSILETPAGFQPNSALVASKVGEFLVDRLQEHQPQVTVIPARKRNTAFSPDDPIIVEPMLRSQVLFLGPGSPTYAARNLKDTLAWHSLLSRHRRGAAVVLASAAAICCGMYALPVYEIYKAGEDLHWQPGLDWLSAYGLQLVFISHWNNNEGGAELDTSRCFMGQDRFARLLSMLPPSSVVVGIDEHTALVFDLNARQCLVMGNGAVTIRRHDTETIYQTGRTFPMEELGPFHLLEPPVDGSDDMEDPASVEEVEATALQDPATPSPTQELLDLVARRETARSSRDWVKSDTLRRAIRAGGWEVRDTPSGPELKAIQ